MKRRKFIQNSLLTGAAISAYPYITPVSSDLPKGTVLMKRPLGKTGEKLSIIGFGGIIVKDTLQDYANNFVSEAIDYGVNYFDVAPTYGNAQDILGPALAPYRKNCFLACKTTKDDREGAENELNESLKKLKTDHIDLYQLHAITKIDEVEQIFGPDGAMETFVKAKQEGKVRFLGFSAHSEEAALLAMEKFDFDTILFPLNFVCWYQGNFGPAVLKKAKEKGMGILALKGLAHRPVPEGEKKPYDKMWYVPIEDDNLASLSLRYTLSLGTTAAIPPGDIRFFRKGIRIALDYTDITKPGIAELKRMSEGVAPLFKT